MVRAAEGQKGEMMLNVGSARFMGGTAFLLLLAGWAATAAAQPESVSVSQVHALERSGVHHLNIKGRLLRPDGLPVVNAQVRLVSGSSQSFPVRQITARMDGGFEFLDVTAPANLALVVVPSEDLIPEGFLLDTVSGRSLDLGDVRLKHNTTIQATVEVVSSKPVSVGHDEIWLTLRPDGDGEPFQARRVGERFVLDHIETDRAELEARLFLNDSLEIFTAPIQIRGGDRSRLLHIRLLRETLTTGDRERRGRLEFREESGDTTRPRSPSVTGILQAPDDTPLSGALLVYWPRPGELGHYAVTGEGGRFRLTLPAGKCEGPGVVFATSTSRALSDRLSLDGECDFALLETQPLRLKLGSATPLSLSTVGLDPELRDQVVYSWWNDDIGWLPIGSARTSVPSSNRDEQMLLKAEAPGHIPVVRFATVPAMNAEQQIDQQETIGVSFHFEASATRMLLVETDGQPLPGAVVDVELIHDLRRSQRIPLGSFRTDASGRLELKGSDSELYQAYAYANGYQPQTSLWAPDRTVELDLRPRDAKLILTNGRGGRYVRVKPTGKDFVVATVRARGVNAETVAVAPGTYDVTVLDEEGSISTITERVQSRESRRVSLLEDHRPRVRVLLPRDAAMDAGWSVGASRSTPSGAAAGWAISTTFGSSFSVQEPTAEIESEAPGEIVLRLSAPGRLQILCSREGLDYVLSRGVTLSPGEELSLSIPPLTARLKGSMKTYEGGKGFSHHGWAGPRLVMLADEPDGWNVTVGLPKRGKNSAFEIPSLPAGGFHLYQHLIGEPTSYTRADGTRVDSHRASDAWGGIPVQLAPNKTTVLRDFAEYPYGALRVSIRGWSGLQVRGATLRIRDRMSEAWRQVEYGGTTQAYAMDPIPHPPAVRVANGSAVLPSIRAGRLELRLEVDHGRVFEIARDVNPEERLEIHLPQ